MSQVNHNYSYIFEVDGHTVWERLRIIRNFLTERRKALALAELNQSNTEEKISRFTGRIAFTEAQLDEHSGLEGELSYFELEEKLHALKYERAQLVIETSDLPDLTQDCRDEIDFLETFEARLMVEAEKERVPGKTDREMYEINFPKEGRTRLFKKATAEIAAHGRLSPDTIHYLRKDQVVLQQIVDVRIPVLTTDAEGNPQEALMALLPPDSVALLQLRPEIGGVEQDGFAKLMVSANPEMLGHQD